MGSSKEGFSRAKPADSSISPELGSGNGRSLQEMPSMFGTEAQSAPLESGSVVGGHSGNISESDGSDGSDAPKGRFAKLAEKGDIDRFGQRGVRRYSDYSGESEESGLEERKLFEKVPLPVGRDVGDSGALRFRSILAEVLRAQVPTKEGTDKGGVVSGYGAENSLLNSVPLVPSVVGGVSGGVEVSPEDVDGSGFETGETVMSGYIFEMDSIK